MENKIYGAAHDVAQARSHLEKALSILSSYHETYNYDLLYCVQDYIMEASAKWLHSAEKQLEELRENTKEELTHE